MNNRSRPVPADRRCAVHGCRSRGVMGFQTLLCPSHRASIVAEHTQRMLARCSWPTCDEYELKPTKHCARHIALIAFHGLQNASAKRTYDALHDEPVTEAQTKSPKTDTAGTIYFLRSGAYFKIGWTSDLEKRMKGYPPDTQLLASQPGTKKDERAIHRRFAHLLGRGREWFVMAPEIEDHIARVLAEHGPAPVVDFTARRANRTAGRSKQYVGGPNRGSLATREVRG